MQSSAAISYIPRGPRWACDFEVVFTDDRGQDLAGRVVNISEDGFMAESAARLPLYSVVSVTLPGRGPVRAEVRWAVDWRFGATILDD